MGEDSRGEHRNVNLQEERGAAKTILRMVQALMCLILKDKIFYSLKSHAPTQSPRFQQILLHLKQALQNTA
jgi:hypothetical protein